MRMLWVVAVLVLAWSIDGAEESVKYLKKKIMNGVIEAKGNTYRSYVLDGPRPYHTFVFFTARHAKYRCDECAKISPEVVLLAQSYDAVRLTQKADDGRDIFFMVVDFDSNQPAYSTHEFTSAPNFVYIPPTTSDEPYEEGTKVKLKKHQIFPLHKRGSKAEDLAEFVRSKTGVHFEIQHSILSRLIHLATFIGVLASSLYILISKLDFFWRKLRSKKLWMAISWIIYTLSVSGMVFCIIRGPPPFHMDRSGKMQLFHPGGRQQFVFEGLIIGGCNAMAALCVIFMTQVAIKIKNENVRKGTMILSMVLFFILYRFIVRAYGSKNQWYLRYTWL